MHFLKLKIGDPDVMSGRLNIKPGRTKEELLKIIRSLYVKIIKSLKIIIKPALLIVSGK